MWLGVGVGFDTAGAGSFVIPGPDESKPTYTYVHHHFATWFISLVWQVWNSRQTRRLGGIHQAPPSSTLLQHGWRGFRLFQDSWDGNQTQGFSVFWFFCPFLTAWSLVGDRAFFQKAFELGEKNLDKSDFWCPVVIIFFCAGNSNRSKISFSRTLPYHKLHKLKPHLSFFGPGPANTGRPVGEGWISGIVGELLFSEIFRMDVQWFLPSPWTLKNGQNHDVCNWKRDQRLTKEFFAILRKF